ncbi:MAG: hypothetical protein MUF01_17120, partial [Bryobacterales bacterium]|nr:hypothetical protein [Bryobacterales bacterium]
MQPLCLQPLRAQAAAQTEGQAEAATEAEPAAEDTDAPGLPGAEELALKRAVIEAQGSPVDLVRGLERHLRLFPNAKRREDIEFALLKTALDLKDDARVLDYGQRFLDTGANDTGVFDQVLPLMLQSPSAEEARKALGYAKRYGQAARQLEEAPPAQPAQRLTWRQRVDR